MKNLKVISAIGSFLAQSRSIKKGAKAVVYHNEQKMKFFRNSSGNIIKSARNCGFGHIY